MTNKENIKQYFVNEDENFSVYFEKDLDTHNYNIIIHYEGENKNKYKSEIQFKIISNALEAFHKLSTWSIKGKLSMYERINLIEDMKQTEIELLKIVEEMKREDNLT